jgi:hypothetical protein|eukprot:SAG25_NODE_360_length_9166_cov_35.113488_3_plen_58_part_00
MAVLARELILAARDEVHHIGAAHRQAAEARCALHPKEQVRQCVPDARRGHLARPWHY